MILITNNDISCNLIIIQSFHHHEDASLALWALLNASSHLYMRVCPSVGPPVRRSVGPSVRPSVRPSVGHAFSSKTGKLMILIANNDVSCNLIIIQSFHHYEDASLAFGPCFTLLVPPSSTSLFPPLPAFLPVPPSSSLFFSTSSTV